MATVSLIPQGWGSPRLKGSIPPSWTMGWGTGPASRRGRMARYSSRLSSVLERHPSPLRQLGEPPSKEYPSPMLPRTSCMSLKALQGGAHLSVTLLWGGDETCPRFMWSVGNVLRHVVSATTYQCRKHSVTRVRDPRGDRTQGMCMDVWDARYVH